MQLTQNESLPEALRRKDEREKVKLPAEEESTADALKEEEAAEEEKVPAAAEAVWNSADGEGDEKNAGDL